MASRSSIVGLLACAAVVLAAGCTSSTTPRAAPTSSAPPRTGTVAPLDPSGSTAPAAASASSSAPVALCTSAGDTTALTTCLETSLQAYWSGALGADVSERVVLHPDVASVPSSCRRGLTEAPAFTCPGDKTLYFTDAFVTGLESGYPGVERGYAFAVVLAHEMGHIVQLQVGQPQIEEDDPSPDTRKFVEQQADCLSGVWAHAVATNQGLDPSEFRTIAERVLTGISTAQEIASHGTPAERVAAIDRGLNGTGAAACDLRTFAGTGSASPAG